MRIIILLLLAGAAMAQSASQPPPPMATTKELMVDMVYPAANEILLFVARGPAGGEKEWDRVRRSAVTLAESGNSLMMPGRARDQRDWMNDARMLVDTGMAAYKASQGKDANTLARLAESLDASCTTCHKQYRPNVFPHAGDAK